MRDRSRRVVLRLISRLNSVTLEGNLKNKIRVWGYRRRVGLPREMNVARGDFVVQVGMWRPASFVRLLDALGPKGRAVLIEPSTEHVAVFRQMLGERDVHGVHIIESGAWSSAGRVDFVVGEDPRTNRIEYLDVDLPHIADEESQVGLAVDTVDHLLEACPIDGDVPIDYLELTVNGVEIEVLKGMTNTLPRVRRMLVAGMMRHESGEPLNVEVAAFLREHGFRTQISAKGREIEGWGQIDGHVFAWRVD